MAEKAFQLYGIKNCSTVKKAVLWLDEHKIAYQFHDFKKEGIAPEKLIYWIKKSGWESLLNKRGTTFRKLSDEEKTDMTEEKAFQLMLLYPSLIKRPVLEKDGIILIGFDEALYDNHFAAP